MSASTVAVVGGGLAGLAASIALADSGFQVQLFERSPRLGGRATSYALSGNEVIDNCQHVTLRCCTNLEDFTAALALPTRSDTSTDSTSPIAWPQLANPVRAAARTFSSRYIVHQVSIPELER